MAQLKTPPAPVSKTVQRLLAQIHAEAEAATLQALSAKDGVVVLQPAERPFWTFHDWSLWMRSGNGAEVHCHQYHEVNGGRPLPHWLVSESRPDGSGRSWNRHLGTHIIDDFGTLVPVQGSAA